MLTLDLGNSSLSVVRWTNGEGSERSSFKSDETLVERLAAWLPSGGSSARPRGPAALSSVGSEKQTLGVVAAVRSAGWDLLAPPDHGLVNACTSPWTVGQDRLFAARAALELCPGGAMVVDAGTAVTVDAVVATDAGGGVFQGGAIAPGPRLLARALGEGGARLPRIEPRPGAPALGRDTAAALESGVVVGFRGAVLGLLSGIERELSAALPVVLTGGARAFLLEPSVFGDRELWIEPDLVHRGLALALGS